MAYEIDMLAVGEGEKSGDAMAVRYGNLHNPQEQVVIVVDGGTKEAGANLVQHIRNKYNTNVVDLVVSTHPDSDHASGLTEVLESLDVRAVLMHKPWDHAQEIKELFKDNRLTHSGLGEKLEKALQRASDIQTIADRKGIPVIEPFAGLELGNGTIRILGPSQEYYEQLIPNFRQTPQPTLEAAIKTVATAAVEALKSAVEWVEESLDIETLDDSGETAPENNSSVIMLLTIDGHKLLFTGDAGIPALTMAADHAASLGIPLNDLHWWQVPHHGSKRNIGPTILSRVIGKTSYISAGKESPKHPAKKVVNALHRRTSQPYATQGVPLWYQNLGLARADYGPATILPFYDKVEK